jgi:hypothetical protein
MELLTYAFDSTCTFPFERCLFKFDGREFVLISGTEENSIIGVTLLKEFLNLLICSKDAEHFT